MNILVLSDHRGHSDKNSLYGMARAIASHHDVRRVTLADRADVRNQSFFNASQFNHIWTINVDESFTYKNLSAHKLNSKEDQLLDYHAIFLRLAWPINKEFFRLLPSGFSNRTIVNDPAGILKTSNKKYLFNFPEFTPEMVLCKKWSQVAALIENKAIVLKPLENYGGKGLARIKDGQVWYDGKDMPLEAFKVIFEASEEGYLAVPYLKNVDKGDKRIFVAGGKIIFSSLRLPKTDGWLCNVAQGGSSSPAIANPNERRMIDAITPKLAKEGIFYYGVDTLVNNHGKRVISEINTLSIGGLTPNEKDERMYLSRRFAKQFIQYVQNNSNEKGSDH